MINSDNKLTLEPTLLPPITELIFKKSEDIGELLNNLKNDEDVLGVNYKNSPHDSESKNFYSSLNNGRTRSLNLMMELSNQPRSYNSLQNTTSNLKKDFDIAKDYYKSQQNIHNKKKQEVRQQVLNVENKLKDSNHLLKSLQTYTLNSFDPLQVKMNEDPLFLTKKVLVHMNMGIAQAIAPPIKLFGETVSAGIHYACDMNDTSRKVCKVTKDSLKYTGNQLLRVMKKTDIVNKAQAVHKFVTVTYPIEMERRYLIPKETTHQYVQDLAVIVPAVIPIPFLPRFSTLAKPFKGLANRICETEFVQDILKMPFILEQFKTPIFALANSATKYTTINQMSRESYVSNILKNESSSMISKSDSHVGQEAVTINRVSAEKISRLSEQLNSFEGNASILPNYSHLEIDGNPIWSRVLEDFGYNISGNQIELKSLEHSFRDNLILTKLTHKNASFLVKEFSNCTDLVIELKGTEYLNKHHLKYLRSPDPVAIGKKGPHNYFMIETEVQGKTIEKLMETMGKTHSIEKRIIQLDDLIQGAHHIGKAVGEFQSKGVEYQSLITRKNKEFYTESIQAFYEGLDTLERKAFKYHFQRPLTGNSSRLQSIVNGYIENPGQLSHGFAPDIGISPFILSNKHSNTIGYIDTNLVGRQKSLNWVEKDYHDFLHSFDWEGFKFGLSLNEIRPLKEAFEHGFHNTYKHPMSFEAQRFFDVSTTMEMIENLALEIKSENHNQSVRVFLEHFTDSLNDKLK